MDVSDVLIDAFTRVQESLHEVVRGLSPEQASKRPSADANSIAWLLWHLARVEDDHLAGAFGREQRWTSAGWEERFGLNLPADAIGYGHTSEEVAAVQVTDVQLLAAYHDAVHAQTLDLVRPLAPGDLDRIVDTRWTPHVTLGVRLVSVINDTTQHVGQAAYLKGLLTNQ